MRRGLGALATGLLGAVAWGSVGAAGDIDTLVAPYLTAHDRGVVGEVVGRIWAGSRTPAGLPGPYASVSIMLLPHSPGFEQALDRIKAGLRDSLRTYADAAGQVVAARNAHERALLEAGAGQLIRGEISDADGRFRFPDVPAGRWVLLAWREVAHPAPGRKVPSREAGRFIGNLERAGHVAVTYWRVQVDVRPGEATTVSLSDRSGWMVAVREELRSPVSSSGDAARRRQGSPR